MIQGMQLQFTSEELKQHFIELADWWEAQGHRAADIILSCRHVHTEAEFSSATKQAKNIMNRGELWRRYANQLPTNEVFRFNLKELEDIQWPTGKTNEVPEAEFERALFFDQQSEIDRGVKKIMSELGIANNKVQEETSGGKGFLS